MASQESRERTKFPEPRGWAMEWVFAVEIPSSVKEQAQEKGGKACRKLAEPRAWAMQWDGFALSEILERRNGSNQGSAGQ